MNTLDALDAQSLRTDLPGFRAGDTLKVHARVVEGNRSRIQIFESRSSRASSSGARVAAFVRRSRSARSASVWVWSGPTHSTARSWTGSRLSRGAMYAAPSSTTCASSGARRRRSRRSARRSPPADPARLPVCLPQGVLPWEGRLGCACYQGQRVGGCPFWHQAMRISATCGRQKGP